MPSNEKGYGAPLPNIPNEQLLKKAKDRILGSTEWLSKQDADADLTAIASSTGTGLLTRTAADTWATRTLTAPAAGITITNPAGVAGNPTFVLANDLAALEAFSSTNGIPYRSAADTWSAVTIGANLTFTGGTLAASGSAWEDVTGSPFTITTTLTVTGLSGYRDLFIVLNQVTASSIGTRMVEVSNDGGSNWGTFILPGQVGALANIAALTQGASTALNASLRISGWGVTDPAVKPCSGANQPLVTAIVTATALDAIRFTNSAGTINGGTIHVLGIPI